jgi:hypothetical protein
MIREARFCITSARRLRQLIQGVFLAVLLTIVFKPATAQVPDPVVAAQAPQPGSEHSYIGVGSETVNPADGQVTFDLPIQTPPGRQLSLPFGFRYSLAENNVLTNQNTNQFNAILPEPARQHG